MKPDWGNIILAVVCAALFIACDWALRNGNWGLL